MEIKNILAVRNDRFGEFLLNIPVFAGLKRQFPNARLTVVVSPEVECLAHRIPIIDDIIIWNSQKKPSLRQRVGLIKRLRSQKWDLSLILNPSKEFNIITYLAGIPKRVGYNRKWGFLLNYRIEDLKDKGLKHEVECNLDLLRPIGIEVKNTEAVFPINIRKEDFSSQRLSGLGLADNDFIIVHPWASNPAKEWPLEKFKKACRGLLLKHKVVVIGGPEETARAEEFCRGLEVIDLTGKTALIELGGLLIRGRLLVTNDSGPMHLAAVLGRPVVALFRNNPHGVSSRRWGPVGTRNIVIENDFIANISEDEVNNGIKKALSQ